MRGDQNQFIGSFFASFSCSHAPARAAHLEKQIPDRPRPLRGPTSSFSFTRLLLSLQRNVSIDSTQCDELLVPLQQQQQQQHNNGTD
jgi:hypothetical protein